ncbi:MAG: glycosyltransferase [Planctomycetota bacterium]|jgi:glycosyltransferase involved in cell wall biosynthesis
MVANGAPRVSVIIPTYNRASFLLEAIASVLAQSFTDFELLVVDDGSTDGTRALLEAVDDPRVRILHHDENRGISATVNTGIRHARGELVSRLDSDDLWVSDMLQGHVAVLDARPEVGVVYGVAEAVGGDGIRIGREPRLPDDWFCSLLYADVTCSIAFVARRLCYDRAGLYDESLRANEDWDMALRLARHFSFAFVDRVVAWFRFHGQNTTGANSPLRAEVIESRVRVLDKAFADPELPATARALESVAYRNVLTDAGISHLAHGDRRAALHAFRRALLSGAPRGTTLVLIVWLTIRVSFLRHHDSGRAFVRGLEKLWRRVRGR